MPQAIVDGVLSFDAFVSITLAILLLFAGKGLAARIGTLGRYGIPEPVLGGVLCAAVVCALYYGAGLMVGSISLTGGVGTTLAWAPHFTDELGIAEAAELGLASNMVGLIAAAGTR
ncbi:sodium/glutamate symporter [Luteimonas sp. A649]